MAAFSPVEASAEGFRLLRQRPVTFIVWMIFWLVFAYGPLVVAFAGMAPKFLDLFQEMRAARDSQDAGVLRDIAHFELGLWPLIGPWILWVSLVQTVFYAAIYRAVLEPSKRGIAYLRIGGDELRIFITRLLVGILLGLFICGLVLAGVAVFMIGRQIAHPWSGWFEAVGVIILACLLPLILVRFSLALPMTFAEKKIRIFESWRLTRGRFWPIVGMSLMLVVYALAISLVFGLLRQGLFFGLGWSTGGFDQLKHLDASGADLRHIFGVVFTALGPALIAAILVQGVADTLLRVVFVAPFARAYALLSGRAAAAE